MLKIGGQSNLTIIYKPTAPLAGPMILRCYFMIGQTETASSRGVSDYANKQTQKRSVASFATVIGRDINFPKYPVCEAGGFIDYN